MRDDILKDIMDRRGAVTRIAKACGISTAAVSRWKRVPRGRVAAVATVTGVSSERLRPDLYPVSASEVVGAE
ncbi:helix-turn-helix domain-containing protein [Acetobacter orientalis]|uniref:YdaS family helix-turn-helix protein n=1 Tax=Acetobacter orientalis TaxID=146474 RepID=UPI0020A352AE|nr:YdaS family helix-turn-helix protein [Acetobacter orientalis]MCP1221352.1 helix-turn-helix domain-containing protein [Acetobacter orientalis]